MPGGVELGVGGTTSHSGGVVLDMCFLDFFPDLSGLSLFCIRTLLDLSRRGPILHWTVSVLFRTFPDFHGLSPLSIFGLFRTFPDFSGCGRALIPGVSAGVGSDEG